MFKKLILVLLSLVILITVDISIKGRNITGGQQAAAVTGGRTVDKATTSIIGKLTKNIGKSYSEVLNKMSLKITLKIINESLEAESGVKEALEQPNIEQPNIEQPKIEKTKEAVKKETVHNEPKNKEVSKPVSEPKKAEEKIVVEENKEAIKPVSDPSPVVEEKKPAAEPVIKALPSNYSISYRSDIEDEVLALVNKLRSDNGLKPFTSISLLKESSRYKSNSMVQLQYFSHNNPNYNNENSGYLLLKIFKVNSSKVGENIAMYTDRRAERITGKGLYDLWYNSEPHRKAMLSDSYTKIGIGVVTTVDGDGRIKIYGTQHFAK